MRATRHALLLLLVGLLAAAWPAPAAGATRACGNVGFEPNSDAGAFGIRATGVRCRTARAVARASRTYGPSGDPGRIWRYRARRFRCVGRELDTALPQVRWRCRRGDALVTFSKS